MALVKTVEEQIAAWQGIRPPNAAGKVMAADLAQTIAAFEKVQDAMNFEEEPAGFEAALRDLAEQGGAE